MSDPVLEILTRMSTQIGQIDGKLDALNDGFIKHVADDEAAHARIASLELMNAGSLGEQRGSSKILHLLAIVGGALLGWVGQFAVNWFRHK